MTIRLSSRAAPWQVIVALATLLCAAPCPRGALAGESGGGLEQDSPSPQVDPEARRLYEQAVAHFKRGELDEAIAKLEAAHRIAPAAELLYNLGQAYRKKGDCRQALASYRRFLDARPDGLARARAEARVAELGSCGEEDGGRPVDAGNAEAPAATLPAESPADARVAATADAAAAGLPGVLVLSPAPAGAEAGRQSLATSPPSWWHRRVPMILSVTAMVLASASGYFAWQSHRASDRMSQTFERGATWTSADADNESSGVWNQRAAVGSGVLGLGAGAIAAWLFWRQ